MTYLKHARLIAALTLTLACGTAIAETMTETFATMDANTDGLVSEAEFVTYATTQEGYTLDEASAKFASMAGNDGVLSLAEFEAVLPDDTSGDPASGRS
ncbi:MAG: EF-hand domain-containing protein [Pseudomonadota bacterium]